MSLLQIGKAYFKQQFGDDLIYHKASQLSNPSWIISNQDENEFLATNIFINMVKSDIEYLDAVRIPATFSIFKCIAHVQFTSLKAINFRNNHIQTIEGIILLNVPVLQQIDLQQNEIVSIRSLRKIKASNLEYLTLYFNRVLEVASLKELDMSQISKIALENFYSDDKVNGQNALSIAGALKSSKLRYFNVDKKCRVHQQRVWKMFQQRYGRPIRERSWIKRQYS